MSQRIQLKRGTAAQWTTANPILADGEMGFERDTGRFKIGNGTAAWASLSYAGGGGGAVAWADVTGKPATFAPSAHGHAVADVTGLQAALDGKQAVGSYAASSHGHAIADVTGLQAAIDGKAALSHGHAIADVAGLQAALDSKGPALPALGPHDWWEYNRFGSNNAAAMNLFVGAAVSSGTNNAALPTPLAIAPDGVFLRSSTTANGGYRYQTSSLVGQFFGGASRKFRGHFKWLTSFTGRTVRIGFHDTTSIADAVDGAYFEILDAVCSAKTANNSTRTTAPTTATLALSTLYTFDIDVNAAGTEARFRVYAGTSATPVLDQTITTNIPTTSARVFGTGIVATEVSTTASDIGVLFGMGFGTVEAFTRAYG